MARPSIKGMIAARKAFQALPEITREALLDAVEETAERIRAGATQRVPVRYGFLSKHIGKTISKRSGFAAVGIAKGDETSPRGKRVQPWRYAHFSEFGATHIVDNKPFMMPAARAEEHDYVQRAKAAGPQIERDMSRIGARFT